MTDLIPTSVHNLIIVDESGSMECIRKQAFTGMNETLQTVRMMQKKRLLIIGGRFYLNRCTSFLILNYIKINSIRHKI